VRDRLGYHVRACGHDLTPADLSGFEYLADRIWKK